MTKHNFSGNGLTGKGETIALAYSDADFILQLIDYVSVAEADPTAPTIPRDLNYFLRLLLQATDQKKNMLI